jgi:phosphoribosyl 1,2-cyclic phosphodiesterase
MKLKVLGSSSKGNCYVLETPTGSILLDAGVPFREIRKAVRFNLGEIYAALITHEHLDHSKAVPDLCRAGIDCIVGIDSFNHSDLFRNCPQHRVNIVVPGKQVTFGDFIILPVEAQHDAPCVAYLIVYKPTGEKLLYATDTYYLKNRFVGLNYILVECNYIPDILKANIEAGLIPESLKNRLLESHFSLDNVKGFLKANDLSEVRKIVLIHLSDGNSDAARMIKEIEELTGKETEVAEAGKVVDLELYPF